MAKKMPANISRGIEAATREDVVPRLRPAAWLDGIRKKVPENQLPVCEAFCGDVLVAYALDLPEQFALLSRPQLDRLGVAEKSLREIAVENMRARLGKVAVRDLDLFQAVEVENDLEACCILLDNFWQQVEERLIEGEVVAAVPCRNGLLFCSADSSQSLEAMRMFVDTTFDSHQQGDPNYLITRTFFHRSGEGWRALPI